MIQFTAEIEYYVQNGDKTGWNYISIPFAIADQLKPGWRRAFRVRGMLDSVEIAGLSTTPVGEGNQILALKQSLRKQLRKQAGDKITVSLEEDPDFKVTLPEDLEICLADEPQLLEKFLKQTKSHQNYFINWINEAKTEATRAKRIVLTMDAMDKGMNYGEMIRAAKKQQ